ncbi:MAG: LON peptidase substrate-binding domain-containing protein, partial [Myxococcales bacterium]|nr:LON peptidase substrate-binding domain-containing protein [Myxococcales bacterium]
MAEADPSPQELPELEQIPPELPLLAVRDIVLYPHMTVPLWVGRQASVAAVDAAAAGDGLIVIAAQRESAQDRPGAEDIHEVGTVASVLRVTRHNDDRVKAIVRGLYRTKIEAFVATEPFFRVRHRPASPKMPGDRAIELEALLRNVQQKIEQILALRNLPREIAMVTHNVTDPGILADLIATNLRLELGEFQALLEAFDPFERLQLVDRHLSTEMEVSEVQQRIQHTAQEEISKSQREYVLREQLKAIQQELG